MGRISGLGGVFYKVAEPERTKRWYREVLGVGGDYGPQFRWAGAGEEAYSLVSPFDAETDYFAPSYSNFMINFKVDDLDSFAAELEAKGVELLGRQDEEYGKFAWILDCDGIKIELWEQVGPAPE
jgi:catechol 2,3-dioxygenase-like lactoylglutathione lyase family enzyme